MRQFLGVVLVIVSFNYLFVADSVDHSKVGLVWLVVALIVWWPDIKRKLGWNR